MTHSLTRQDDFPSSSQHPSHIGTAGPESLILESGWALVVRGLFPISWVSFPLMHAIRLTHLRHVASVRIVRRTGDELFAGTAHRQWNEKHLWSPLVSLERYITGLTVVKRTILLAIKTPHRPSLGHLSARRRNNPHLSVVGLEIHNLRPSNCGHKETSASR